MNKAALVFASALWGLCTSALADEPVFQQTKDVAVPAVQREELLAITLDQDVFASTDDGFSDIRLHNGERQQVPFLLRKVQTTRVRIVRNTWTGRQPSLRPLDDGGLEITVRLDDDDPQPNGLQLVTPLRDFEQRMRIQTSEDGQLWESAGDETIIFDYSRFMDVRGDRVSFPKTARRHFRIIIDNVTAKQESELLALTRRLRGAEETDRVERVTITRRPFRIDRIDFWEDSERRQGIRDEQTEYPVTGFQVTQNPEKQQTIIHFDTEREPLTSVKCEVLDRNFSRRAAVEVEEQHGARSTWRVIGEATLSRIDFRDLKREQLSISFPESRRTEYRIVIDNRDSPPLNVAGVKGEGNVYELVFLAAPEQNYHLVYGAADAQAGSFDTAAIQELLREEFQPTQVELGEQHPNPDANRIPEFKWSKLLNDGRLLVGVISLLVVVLGWGLYHAVKRMDNLPEEPGDNRQSE